MLRHARQHAVIEEQAIVMPDELALEYASSPGPAGAETGVVWRPCNRQWGVSAGVSMIDETDAGPR